MAYPFVQARYDYGPRKGPVRGFLVHMAENDGGTVAYLARDPARGVSVHYVVENTGRIVQMLREDHASGSVNPRDIRKTDDADGFYGRTAAVAVLGSWADDPNAAVISLEMDGRAVNGPNARQLTALVKLAADVRSRHPGIGNLGHRDFADYKPCPGRFIPWTAMGGHGQETVMPQTTVTLTPYADRSFTSKPGLSELRRFSATSPLSSITTPYSATVDADAVIEQSDGRVPHGPGFLRLSSGGSAGLFVLLAEIIVDVPPPVVDCDDVVTVELQKASERAAAAVLERT